MTFLQPQHQIAKDALACLRTANWWEREAARRQETDPHNYYGYGDAAQKAQHFFEAAYELYRLYKLYKHAGSRKRNKIERQADETAMILYQY